MFNSLTRLLSFVLLIAGLLVTHLVGTAYAQAAIGVDKKICVGTPDLANLAACTLPVLYVPTTPTATFYAIKLTANQNTPSSVTLTDTYPVGFNFVGAACYATG